MIEEVSNTYLYQLFQKDAVKHTAPTIKISGSQYHNTETEIGYLKFTEAEPTIHISEKE